MATFEEEEKERLNHQAYNDVLDLNGPSLEDNNYYMECYRFWDSVNYNFYDNIPFDEPFI